VHPDEDSIASRVKLHFVYLLAYSIGFLMSVAFKGRHRKLIMQGLGFSVFILSFYTLGNIISKEVSSAIPIPIEIFVLNLILLFFSLLVALQHFNGVRVLRQGILINLIYLMLVQPGEDLHSIYKLVQFNFTLSWYHTGVNLFLTNCILLLNIRKGNE
jgi:hypothetical protein